MKRSIVLMAMVMLLIPISLSVRNSWAEDEGTFLDHVIPVPGFTNFSDPAHPHGGSFDISWFDAENCKYYLADRGFATSHDPGRIDVFDALADTYLFSIPGFVGNHGSVGGPDPTTGPNGIVVIHPEKGAGEFDQDDGARCLKCEERRKSGKEKHETGELWAGDGDSTVKVIDLETGTIVATIATDSPHNPATGLRADELAYDPIHGVILIANDAAIPFPFITFISQASRQVLKRIVYDGQDGRPDALDGIEQPVFDNGFFYLAVPQTTLNPGGEIDVIDPVGMTIVARFSAGTGCNPHGLAVGPKHQLMLGCNNSNPPKTPQHVVVMDESGNILANIPQVGGVDEVWFNCGDKRYYLAASGFSSGPVLGVIDAQTNMWVENLPGGAGAHSVAANPTNNHIFFPVTIPNAGGYTGTPNVTVPPLLQSGNLGLGIAVFEHEVEFKHEK